MVMFDDLFDFARRQADWLKMSWPLAIFTALVGGFFAVLIAAIGVGQLLHGEALSALHLLAFGGASLAGIVIGAIAFLRAKREAS
jgi:uncharacterized membrane protein